MADERATGSLPHPDAAAEVQPQEAEDVLSEELNAQRQAARLGLEYLDLDNFEIDAELFRSIPVDLMFRYNFVPRHRTAKGLVIVVSDPTDVLMIDDLELLLGSSIEVCVGTQTAIQDILQKSESSQRVLDEATDLFCTEGNAKLGVVIAGIAILAQVIPALSADPLLVAPAEPVPEGFGGYRQIGIAMYTDYVLLVEMASLLLLGAIVGALILAKRKID